MEYKSPTPEELEHEHKYLKYQMLWTFFKPMVIGWSLFGLYVWLFR